MSVLLSLAQQRLAWSRGHCYRRSIWRSAARGRAAPLRHLRLPTSWRLDGLTLEDWRMGWQRGEWHPRLWGLSWKRVARELAEPRPRPCLQTSWLWVLLTRDRRHPGLLQNCRFPPPGKLAYLALIRLWAHLEVDFAQAR